MKQITFWIGFFLLLLGVNCQLEEISPLVKTFKKQVKVSDLNTYLAGIYQRSKLDSNYHVLMNAPGGAATVLLDEDGIKTGDFTTYSNVEGGIRKGFSNGNDGFFLIGERTLNSNLFPPQVQPFFAHIPTSGSALYREFDMGPNPSDYSNVYDAVMTSKGTIMACGTVNIESIGNYDIGIIELDANAEISSGFPKNMKKYGYRGTGIVEMTSGGFIMTAAGWTNFSPYIDSSLVLRFSEDYSSSIPWEWQIPTKDLTSKTLRLFGIEKTGGNTFVIYDGGSIPKSNYIAGIDADFNIKWEKVEQHGITKIIRTSDGNFVVLGNADNKIFLTKRSSENGDDIWSESYAETSGGTIQAVTVSETLDGGFIIGGNYTMDSKTDIYVIKTDDKGKVYE